MVAAAVVAFAPPASGQGGDGATGDAGARPVRADPDYTG
jgi:hypothetical protein